MPGSFFDSNIILYFALSSSTKSLRASHLVAQGGNINVQVLNECANVLRSKRARPWPEVQSFLSELCVRLDLHPITLDIHRDSLRLAERYNFAIYDSFIVAAALAADCDTLFSEDMQDGMVVDGRLRITNPFPAPGP
jgi:predicted nucleic acid-binding protein